MPDYNVLETAAKVCETNGLPLTAAALRDYRKLVNALVLEVKIARASANAGISNSNRLTAVLKAFEGGL